MHLPWCIRVTRCFDCPTWRYPLSLLRSPARLTADHPEEGEALPNKNPEKRKYWRSGLVRTSAARAAIADYWNPPQAPGHADRAPDEPYVDPRWARRGDQNGRSAANRARRAQ